MHVFVNELSFVSQAPNKQQADNLMSSLIDVINDLNPFCGQDPICTSHQLWQKELAPGLTVQKWLSDSKEISRDKMRYLSIVLRKGPYVETLLDENFNYYECHFDGVDVCNTSLAGAALYSGLLSSLQAVPRFNVNKLLLQCKIEDGELTEVSVLNVYNPADQTAYREIRDLLASTITSWDSFWEQKDKLYPELIFCDDVYAQLAKINIDEFIGTVFEHLSKMNSYIMGVRRLREKDEKVVPEYSKMGIRASQETEITLKHYGYQREFVCPDDVKRTFTWHSKQMGKNFRIHFYPPDGTTSQFIIGYIGLHLDTYLYH